MMRYVPMLALAALTAAACGEEAGEEAPPIVAESEPAAVAIEAPGAVAVDVAPAHGGTVVTAGPHPVEVVTHDDGAVEAYFVGDAPPPPNAQVTVRVPTPAGPRPTVLVWDPSHDRFRGAVRGARVVEGPVEVVVSVGPERFRGSAPTIVIVEPGPPDVVVEAPPRPSSTVVVERPAPPRATVVVERPSRPTVVVERPSRPRVDVRIEAPGPPPPPSVVVRRPRGPNVVVHRPAGPRVEVRGPRGPRVRVRHRDRDHRVDEDWDDDLDEGRGRGRGRRGRGRRHRRGDD